MIDQIDLNLINIKIIKHKSDFNDNNLKITINYKCDVYEKK